MLIDFTQTHTATAVRAVRALDRARGQEAKNDGTVRDALAVAALAIACAEPTKTGPEVTRALGERLNAVVTDMTKSTVSGYRSRLAWLFGAETKNAARVTEGAEFLASLRRDVGDVSQMQPADFDAAIVKAAARIGDYAKQYNDAMRGAREDDKASKVAHDAAEAERGAGFEADPVLAAQTAAILAIQTLQAAGATDALAEVAAFLNGQALTVDAVTRHAA